MLNSSVWPTTDAFFFSRRDQFVGLASHYSVPTVYPKL